LAAQAVRLRPKLCAPLGTTCDLLARNTPTDTSLRHINRLMSHLVTLYETTLPKSPPHLPQCARAAGPGLHPAGGVVTSRTRSVSRALRVFLVAIVTLSACQSLNEESAAPAGRPAPASVDPPATAIVGTSPAAAPSATESLVAVVPPTTAPSSPSALPSLAPTVPPVQTASGTPAQTRVPNSSTIPSPQGLPASDGCLTYGAQPPYISFVDCVVHGLPPAAPVTLTANGEAVFLRIGRTDVYPDGSWYFAWSETVHKEIVFVVTAGGVSRTITQVFR
jgi:hypothetical protein